MIGFRQVLAATAISLSLGLAPGLALAQGGPPAAAQGEGYGPGYGYGPGMMRGYGPGPGYGHGRGYGRGYGYGPGMMWGGGGGYGPGMMWGWAADPATAENAIEGRLAFLKAELRITAQQSALWDKYAAAMRDSAKSMYERHRSLFERDWADESLPQRLELREQLMTVGLDSMRKTDAALKPLYAALDENQKKIADEYMGFGMGAFHGGF